MKDQNQIKVRNTAYSSKEYMSEAMKTVSLAAILKLIIHPFADDIRRYKDC